MSHARSVSAPIHPTQPCSADDVELFVAWRCGDDVAGTRLLRHLRVKLLRYLRDCPCDLAEDLAHDALVALLAARDELDEPAALFGYLFTTARRIRARHRARNLVPVAELDERLLPAGQSSRIALAHIDVTRLLATQRGRCAGTLAEYYLAGLRAPEIAAAHGVSEGTVRSRLRHGLDQLRRSAGHPDLPSAQPPRP